jgi:cytochrome b
MEKAEKRLVWDLPLRLFHWLFALSILACWGTAKLGFTWMKWHLRLGYWVMGLLVFRLIWGFVGPKHARFSSFLKGPGPVLRYAGSLIGRGESRHSVGHNPLGALMVVLMLLLVAVQAGTGLFTTDDIAWAGPYYGSVSDALAKQLTALHDLNFNFIWAAIGLHLAAILYYTVGKKESLVPPMVSGWKRAEWVPDGQAIANSELWKAAIVIAASGAVVWAVLHGAPPAGDSSNVY